MIFSLELLSVLPFSSSLIIIGLGIVGQYLARVYDELKKRPVYVVADELGFEPPSETGSN